MGYHWLNTERMRVVEIAHIPRSMRHCCQMCGFQKPEDEMHMFDCPFYNDIRLRYQKLFTDIYRHVNEDTDRMECGILRFHIQNLYEWKWH